MILPHLTGANTLLAYAAFAIGLASPGPSVLAVSCAAISATIFYCYALAFSTHAARHAYRAGERWVNAVLAGVFAYAGVRMLLTGQAR